jgi:hypothetical protein
MEKELVGQSASTDKVAAALNLNCTGKDIFVHSQDINLW